MLPSHCADLWRIFLDLHSGRDGMGGPIRFVDLHAFETVTGLKLAPWEIRAIQAADARFLVLEAERVKRD